MAKAGHHYPDPLAAITDQRWQTQRRSAEEIGAAQTDVRCKETTGLVAIWAAAETRVQNTAIHAHPDKFATLKAVKTGELANARHIIARG